MSLIIEPFMSYLNFLRAKPLNNPLSCNSNLAIAMERAPVTELHREAHRRMIRRNQLNTKQVAGRAVSGGHSSANSPLAVLIEIVASGVWRDAVVAVARQGVAKIGE